MIEALKDDAIIDKVGGRFKLASLIHKRYNELLQGSRPLVKREEGMTDLETIIEEIMQDKVAIDYANSDVAAPDRAK
ncbi:MAG: DNA-directed RNA polymerase subunit omega [Phycisphaerae bacterium]|jgi:DNA-directed RNA polymerase subunit omega|nr:DNA-directed RNA polymerase subunit omega [Phycisphaerae bacterium]